MSALDTRGYVRADAAPSMGERVRTNRGAIALVALFVTVALVLGFTRSSENAVPLSINNPGELGAQALAQVAGDQGLRVVEISSLSKARIGDPSNTTIVIADGAYLQPFQARAILAFPGDVVVLGDAAPLFDAMGAQLEDAWGNPGVLDAQCDDPDAAAAGLVDYTGETIRGTLPANAEGCFPGIEGEWMYVSLENAGHRRVFISDSTVVTNGKIALEGNAALALRAIGHHRTVVWYLGSQWDGTTLTWADPNGEMPINPHPTADGGEPPGPGEPGQGEPGDGEPGNDSSDGGNAPPPAPVESAPEFLPPGTGNFLYALGLALILVVLWRARRFGALVTEPLPVVIRASEATRGRARLYRAARSYGRAGVSLRAGTVSRLAKKLGVSRHENQAALIAAVSRVTRRPAPEVEELLFGDPPGSESAMIDLASELDQLEREVHGK